MIHQKSNWVLILTLTITGFLLPFAAKANDTLYQKSIFDVMNFQEVLKVTLEADFASLDTNRRNPDAYKATLSFVDAQAIEQKWAVQLKARGNFRRLKCEMVPLKIEFKKKELKAAGLAKFDDMKLVTHCVTDKRTAKALLQKEYLAYKLYNGLTENSFRVQLLKITYKDVKSGKKSKHWAFLIEDTAQLKSRIGAVKTCDNCLNLPRDTFQSTQLKIAAVFQYMIGNSDWDLKVGRNVKYVLKKEKIIAIPYDFDFSGLVNAPYAIPNPNYNIPDIKSRIFLGFPEDIEQLKGIFSYFKTKRADLLKIVENFKPLPFATRLEIASYLDDFYNNLEKLAIGEKMDPNIETQTVLNEKK